MIKKKELESMLGEMRVFAKEQQIPISSPESIKTIEEILEHYKPKHCLEVGTCIGFGTIEIARRIIDRGGQIESYEISIPTFALAQSYTKQSGLSNIHLHFQNILETLDFGLLAQNMSESTFDFIYIDGQKSKYLDFLFHLLPFANQECIILFDDVLAFPEKTQELRDRIKKYGIPYRLIQHNDGDGMLLLKMQNVKCKIQN